MKNTSRAFASRVCVVVAVILCGCAQVLGIDGWTDKGAGGQGGEQSSSSAMGGQGAVGSSSAGTGGQTTVSSTGGQTTVSSTGSGNCTADGMSCQDSGGCCSQACEGGVCVCLGLGKACAGSGCCGDLVCGNDMTCCRAQGNCTADADCCSQTCVNGTCGIACTGEMMPCNTTTECCTGLVCGNGVCSPPCQSDGQPCSISSDCCANFVCLGGVCSPSCTLAWNYCVTDNECCPGLHCPTDVCTIYDAGQAESGPNDSQVTANTVYLGTVCGGISPAGDQDWFKISLPAGVHLFATVDKGGNDTCGPMGAIDSEIEIRSSTAQLSFNDDIAMTNLCSIGNFVITTAGTYYVRVAASQANSPSATFAYCVMFQAWL